VTTDPSPRALLSVFDKTGLVDLAAGLVDLGWELVSSGGTFRVLVDAGLPVLEVAQVTQAPEMLDGRVKTLHPGIHGGILADRSKPEHLETLAERGIAPIDLVVSNLYPFNAEPSIEMIDIGGPTMVRAAAKNHDAVGILTTPDDYDDVLDELRTGRGLSAATRRRLARAAFAHTAAYDAAIVAWLDDTDEATDSDDPLPDSLHLTLDRVQDLRYGENPHQVGARYRLTNGGGWWDTAVQHNGKQLSYLNLYDTEAAWHLAWSISGDPTVAVIKHANPCGLAVADTVAEAYVRADACDPVSAFGGIIATNRPVTAAMVAAMAGRFTEVIVAPEFEADALDALQAKKNLRVIEASSPSSEVLDMRSISGGLLVQTADRILAGRNEWTVATERGPTDAEWADLDFAWRVVARVMSNTIVLAKDRQAVGIGAGQQNRRDAGRIAAQKADGRAVGGVCASDAFFPFSDGLEAAIDAGCTAVIQPGGSIRDDEVIAAANEANIAMVFTAERHFRH
jgi:phosphoribosylaminoimidazolecarboxamide formyltransferase/IMP cyclohydrolase